MIAEVYPLTRLPRRFTFFDYRVPEALSAKPGDIVKVALKGRSVFGVVRAVKTYSTFKRLSGIEEILAPRFFNEKDIHRIETIAEAIFQSPSNVFSATLQGWKPLHAKLEVLESKKADQRIHENETTIISETIRKLGTTKYISAQLSAEGEFAVAQILRKKYSDQLLIICPTERQAELIAKTVSLGSVAVLHGKTTSVQRRAIMESWKSGVLKTLIGTRQAALIPAKMISAVIVTHSGAEEYRMLDKNPRIDARNAVTLLAKQHGAPAVFTGPLPRMEEVYNSTCDVSFQNNAIQIINLNAKEEYTGIPLVTDTLKTRIDASLSESQKTLLLYNKKGVAKRLQCGDCGHVPLCGTCGAVPQIRVNDLVCAVCQTEMWAPKTCPACGSDKMREKGLGNKRLETEIKTCFPDASVAVIDKEHPDADEADILIVTEFYFQNMHRPFMPRQFGVVSDIAFDLSLTGEHFRSAEHAAYRLHRLGFFARQQHAACIVQSWLPDVPRKMLRAEKWIKNELKTREKYSLPPTSPLYTLLDKTSKKTYKTPLDDFKKLPDSTIINVDTIDYEHVPRTQKPE